MSICLVVGGALGLWAVSAIAGDWPQYRYDSATGSSAAETTLSPANVGGLQVRWHAYSYGGLSAPGVMGGLVYVGNTGGCVSAVVVASSSPAWRWCGDSMITSSPLVANGVVYVAASDLCCPYGAFLDALDAASGSLLRRASLGNGDNQTASPVLARGAVLVVANETLFSIDAPTGSINWQATGPGGGFEPTATPALSGGVVYLDGYLPSSPNLGTLYAIDPGSGAASSGVRRA